MSGAARSRPAPPCSPRPDAPILGSRRLRACVSTRERGRVLRASRLARGCLHRQGFLCLERARTAGPRRVAVRPFREDGLFHDTMGREVGQQHLSSEGRDESGGGFCTGGRRESERWPANIVSPTLADSVHRAMGGQSACILWTQPGAPAGLRSIHAPSHPTCAPACYAPAPAPFQIGLGDQILSHR